MARTPLGRLVEVELREYWPREDTDFTPWLAEAENLKLLGDTVGLVLERLETEAGVGPFRADILCREAGSDELVLIENQLEPTDHTHLGQILTYAAGLDTVHVIWVARQFTDEHRAALDWLNRITDESFKFFGVEVQLWRIGDSPPAPRFNIVSQPNEWSKAVKAGPSRPDPERARMYRELWTVVMESLEARDLLCELPRPTGLHWLRFRLPDVDSIIIVSYAPSTRLMSVYLSFWGEDRMGWARFMKEHRAEFESAIGPPFEWLPGDDGIEYGYATLPLDHEDPESVVRCCGELGELLERLSAELVRRHLAWRAATE